MRRGLGRHNRRSAGGPPTVRSIFGANLMWWLDLQDLSTVYADFGGTPGSVGQPAAIVLDKKAGALFGAERVTNGNFSNGLTGWTNSSTGAGTASVSGGVLTLTRVDASNVGAVDTSFSTVAGRLYKVSALLGATGGPQLFVGSTQGNTDVLSMVGLSGQVTAFFIAATTTTWLRLNTATNASSATFGNISVTECLGSPAYNTTAAQRPILQSGSTSKYLLGDYVNDKLTAALSALGSIWTLYRTPDGWMQSGPAVGGAAATVPLGYNAASAAITSAATAPQAAALSSLWGVTQKYFVGSSNTTTNFHNIVSSNGPYTLTYTGANGVTYSTNTNNVTTNLAAQGLTAPIRVAYPIGLATDAALTAFYCYSNQLTGSIPSLTANTALTVFDCGGNQLTGSIPSLNTAMRVFTCGANQLTGSIPSLTANTALTSLSCGLNQLTGSIPSLTANTALMSFNCSGNQLTGSIPSLTANTALTVFYCYSNQLTGWTGGTVSATLGDFEAQNNLLTQAAVDAILAAFVAAGRSTGTRVLNLGGTGNATPSSTGLTNKATLVSRGWTVTTN